LRSRTTSNADARAKAKDGKYVKSMEGVGVQFASFVVESHGWLHSSASDVLRALAFNAKEVFGVRAGDVLGYLKRRVAVAVQRGNCMLEAYARQRSRNTFGAVAAAGLFHVLPNRARGGGGGGVAVGGHGRAL
jgi:hypothetical protein